jgi:hypothetical protein
MIVQKSDVHLGDTVEYYTSSTTGTSFSLVTTFTSQATIIGIPNDTIFKPWFLIGWKEPPTCGAMDFNGIVWVDMDKVLDFDQYRHLDMIYYGWEIVKLTGVSSSRVTSSHRGGMFCQGCGNFNDYAEPNMKDGSHKCWSCRI